MEPQLGQGPRGLVSLKELNLFRNLATLLGSFLLLIWGKDRSETSRRAAGSWEHCRSGWAGRRRAKQLGIIFPSKMGQGQNRLSFAEASKGKLGKVVPKARRDKDGSDSLRMSARSLWSAPVPRKRRLVSRKNQEILPLGETRNSLQPASQLSESFVCC